MCKNCNLPSRNAVAIPACSSQLVSQMLGLSKSSSVGALVCFLIIFFGERSGPKLRKLKLSETTNSTTSALHRNQSADRNGQIWRSFPAANAAQKLLRKAPRRHPNCYRKQEIPSPTWEPITKPLTATPFVLRRRH